MSARVISLDDASAGMLLADALLDAHGGLLLPQGAALTASSLASLRRRGIEQCSVVDTGGDGRDGVGGAGRGGDGGMGLREDDGVAADPAALERRRALAVERLRRLFRHCADGEAGAVLLHQLIDYRLREAS